MNEQLENLDQAIKNCFFVTVQERCCFETIQEDMLLKPLDKNQDQFFNASIKDIRNSINNNKTQCPTLTYRGVSRDNLIEKLTKKTDSLDIDEAELFSQLFYFGDKAKACYKADDKDALESRIKWLSRLFSEKEKLSHKIYENYKAALESSLPNNIEDHTSETSLFIFDKISYVLKYKKPSIIGKFSKRCPVFYDYFNNNKNRLDFSKQLTSFGNYARDYYLYFLHTSGNIGIGYKSFLVSTSLSYYEAQKFSKDKFNKNACKRYVIVYVVPTPIDKFAVTHKLIMPYEDELKKLGMPVYEGASLYPPQHEVAIRGALFPHHILGVRVVDENRFIVNPHLFNNDKSDSILHGLEIDQSDFDNKLPSTKYKSAVGTHLDGNFHTIN